jgi:histidinol dehydrogenase
MGRVKLEGDSAVIDLTQKYDGVKIDSLEVSSGAMSEASARVSDNLKDAIARAIANIEQFHRAQIPGYIRVETQPGVDCMLRYYPLERVGLYIPGGTAPLISTVLMLAVPAKVAGCRELIACTPPEPSAEIMYVCGILGVRLFRAGGAQAIAAMAYGTETIPRVDKLFGPGNRYVTEAKVQATSRGIPIDMPAGPSEVLVIADESSDPGFVAADLLSQAEHGADSQVVLLSASKGLIERVRGEIDTQLNRLPRKEIAQMCLNNSVAIYVNSIDQAIDISNYYAPEHLILAVVNASEYINRVRNAGSVFIGNYSPESAGDYASGTNHTLPTGGFARSWSGVTVQSFMKSITFQQLSRQGLQSIAPSITALARAEGLEAHARAVEIRLNS